jgi:hypothetical protein
MIDIVHHYLGAFRRSKPRMGLADTPSGTGDDNSLAVQYPRVNSLENCAGNLQDCRSMGRLSCLVAT